MDMIRKPLGLSRVLAFLLVLINLTPAFASSSKGMVSTAETQENTTKIPAAITGKVLPTTQKPQGYTLKSMAIKTGYYNSCRTGPDPSNCEAPKTPFQILTFNTHPGNEFTVSRNTTLYMPIFWFSSFPPMQGSFPMATDCDVNHDGSTCYNGPIGTQDAVLNYIFNPDQVGIQQIRVWIDGRLTVLGSDYVWGVNANPRLVDGTQAYIVAAAFINNLPRGEHKIGFGVSAIDPDDSGEYKDVYTVHVE